MLLREILRAKGNQVHTASPGDTLADVVNKLVGHNIGSLVVMDGQNSGRVLGIITERDILRACAAHSGRLDEIDVTAAMTEDVCYGSPIDSVPEVMNLMTEQRIRHLPVMEGDRMVGIISIGDVVKAQTRLLSTENHYLKEYILG